MIITLEIPHQGQPLAWACNNQEEFTRLATNTWFASNPILEYPDLLDFDAAVQWNGRDLSQQYIWQDIDDAARAAIGGIRYNQPATRQLRDLVRKFSWEIRDPELRQLIETD